MLLTRMADAVDASLLPDGLPGYAGYVDGKYVSFPSIVSRFYPHAHCVSITVEGCDDAAFIDCELGNHTPAFCVKWLVRQLTRDALAAHDEIRWWHGIYFPASYHQEVLWEIDRQMPQIDRSRYRLWMARWSGQIPAALPLGVDALQCIGGENANYDVSVVAPDFYLDYVERAWRVQPHADIERQSADSA